MLQKTWDFCANDTPQHGGAVGARFSAHDLPWPAHFHVEGAGKRHRRNLEKAAFLELSVGRRRTVAVTQQVAALFDVVARAFQSDVADGFAVHVAQNDRVVGEQLIVRAGKALDAIGRTFVQTNCGAPAP